MLLLIQNFTGNGAFYDDPLWTMPIEALAYAFLPLMLLVFRRLGPDRGIAMIIVVSMVLDTAVMKTPLAGSGFWLLPSFAIGLWAAHYSEDLRTFPSAKLARDLAFVCPAIIVALSISLMKNSQDASLFEVDSLGGGCALAIWFWLESDSESAFRRFLQSSIMSKIGKVSYSLYLFHMLIMTLIAHFIPPHSGAVLRTAILLFIGLPLSLAVSQGSWYLFERPFLSAKRRAIEESHLLKLT